MPLTSSRYRMLVGAVLCLLAVTVLTVLYRVNVRVLDEVDNGLGDGPQAWTYRNRAAQDFLLLV